MVIISSALVLSGKEAGEVEVLALAWKGQQHVDDGEKTGRDRRPQYLNGSDNGAPLQIICPGGD